MRCNPSQRQLVVWGASGHAAVVIEAIRALEMGSIVGLIDDDFPSCRRAPCFGGLPILGDRTVLGELRERGVRKAFVAIGDSHVRVRLAAYLGDLGFELPTIVHPNAYIAASVAIGSGSFVAASAVVSENAVVGDNVVINTGATVDHDCVIESGAHVAPGCSLAGGVCVRDRTLVGIGSVAAPRVQIGCDVVIGAGSVVLRDIPDRVIAYGNPARVIRPIEVLENE